MGWYYELVGVSQRYSGQHTVLSNAEVAQMWCQGKGSENWTLGDSLGCGATAEVFEIIGPDGPRALKVFIHDESDRESKETFAARIERQVSLGNHDCPNLVKVYESAQVSGRTCILMDRAEGVELQTCLNKIPRDCIRVVLDQIARAMIFLRSQDVCHRDVKAANIFVSEDFQRAVLLDISVIREIHDPIGSGTDQNGSLPVVATSRYCPPEYLFRLVEAGPQLWHALDIYQLGALAHDMIMGRPLFQEEYERDQQNRYRFAWVVATTEPLVAAHDVDHDLIRLAKLGLDKDWNRRSQLMLEDFLDDARVRRDNALSILGFQGSDHKESKVRPGELLQGLRITLDLVEGEITKRLRDAKITAHHKLTNGPAPWDFTLEFAWENETDNGVGAISVEFKLHARSKVSDEVFVELASSCSANIGGIVRFAQLDLIPQPESPEMAEQIASEAMASLGTLSVYLVEGRSPNNMGGA